LAILTQISAEERVCFQDIRQFSRLKLAKIAENRDYKPKIAENHDYKTKIGENRD
jgi:hypothetical protein